MATECVRIKKIAAVDAGILKMACMKVASLKGFSLKDTSSDQTKLKFATGLSFFSWGETIEIDIQSNHDSLQLEVRSRCALSTQLDDGGKNEQNVDKILYLISTEAGMPLG
jgi:hypothetical protein